MPATPAQPLSYWDLEPHTPPNPPRERRRRRRRALHPVVVAVVAVLAVGVASVVGTLVFGSPGTRAASAADRDNRGPAGTDALFAAGTPAAAPVAGDPGAPSGPATTGPPAPPVPSSKAGPGTKAPTAPATGDPTAEGAVLTLVNQERAKVPNCRPLGADSRLATAARLHSQDMADRNYFDHTTPDGVTFDRRITAAGYKWSNAGENIAKGQKDAASVMQAWMNSPGHRANILNCKFKDIGIGLAYDSHRTPYWTQDFGAQL